ncbi:MAG: Gfo/Idh/MocA family oxidoreductase [Alphaproteobacteria bacterium]
MAGTASDAPEPAQPAGFGRRVRLGVVGGGPGSFIGPIHRLAARMDDRFAIVASVLSADPGRSRDAGLALGIAPDRAYADADALFAGEAARTDAIDALAVMTPNDSHFALAARAVGLGWDVVCDKPLTTGLDDARALVRAVDAAGVVFCTTYNYSAFPMVRQARAMVRDGRLGPIRQAQVCYVQPFNARLGEAEAGAGAGRPWRLVAEKVGESMVLGDIGTHAFQLLEFVAGEPVAEVLAEVGAIVPGRQVDDYAMALLRLAGGGRATFWVTNAAAGAEHGLYLRIFGDGGGLEWWEENPNYLRWMPHAAPVQLLARDGPGLADDAARVTRTVFGHPEGYQEAFANLYREVADAIVDRRLGRKPAAPPDFPTVRDGARGIAFIAAAKRSAAAGGTWTAIPSVD